MVLILIYNISHNNYYCLMIPLFFRAVKSSRGLCRRFPHKMSFLSSPENFGIIQWLFFFMNGFLFYLGIIPIIGPIKETAFPKFQMFWHLKTKQNITKLNFVISSQKFTKLLGFMMKTIKDDAQFFLSISHYNYYYEP